MAPHGALRVALLLALALVVSCDTGLGSTTDSSPYITQVFDYKYGVGQHASLVGPDGMAHAQRFVGTDSRFVYLGGWGGYIVAGFDHDVPNLSGKKDFAVYTQPGVGDEPGVVFVMADVNGNGLPDDIWYELSGSETGKCYNTTDCYIRDYQVTYFRPTESDDNIIWEDNQDPQGYGELVPGFGDSSASWWWEGRGNVDKVTFSGVKLPNSKHQVGSDWNDFVDRHTWGYAENYSGTDLRTLPFGTTTRTANVFDIGNAVDGDGNPVSLPSIRFIKIQTGVFQIAGWLNEVSTEVSGAVSLHHPDIAAKIDWQ
ncbi:MAG: hypothetical protein EA403_04545 [Spirochaetaceae bacterium]|nr:MAG: hypothetical protein EA403_04545 [Spirochaetaceae bacterium]